MEVVVCERKEISAFVEKYHYSQNVNGMKTSVCFKLVHNDEIVGAIMYGAVSTTAWKRYGEKESDVMELRRLILLDDVPRNSESWFISRTIAQVKELYPYVKVLVSYADPAHGHVGYVYQATNWIYLGQSNKDVLLKDLDTGRVYHSRSLRVKSKGEFKPFVKVLRQKQIDGRLELINIPGKLIYVYPLNKKTRKEFLKKSKPYEKLVDNHTDLASII